MATSSDTAGAYSASVSTPHERSGHVMDDQDPLQKRLESSRPSIGFPLGIGLLFVLIFGTTAFFCFCYHWDKLRSLYRITSASATATTNAITTSTDTLPSPKPTTPRQDSKQNQSQSLPVLMPGDVIPKFMAWPNPCEQLPTTRITEEEETPPLAN